ncbi:hypothetical protein N7462_000406 [Penicillium macrosclerotiorum]|uniref:uncharacterized protein n=1 Tax=Penicillium macrosclerotiorum TaxID=303699 RepID=UPI0025470C28|nr:uncharacterized protein N7462_000406 [Penicillium macrosclerotiorum]KAJ5698401.1 hypothetical protein N7462_000406 [Penicillium macrosclerotiorum]
MGCANYHARVRFENGPAWLLRVPRINGSIPQQLIDSLIRSEYATLKFLETTQVPAPRAFGYDLASDSNNRLGVSYILIEEMPDKPWNQHGPHGKRSADKNDKNKVWNELADILIKLKSHPFPKAGSLLPGPLPSNPIVSAIASERFLVLSPSGPYDTSFNYYTITHRLWSKICPLLLMASFSPSFPLNAYLVFLFLKSQIQDISPKANYSSVKNTEQFFIKHVDDKGDHLMVDDEVNVIGFIDWQMARVVPADEAFGPSLVTAEMGDIYDGFSSMTIHDRTLARLLKERGEDGLAGIMCKNEKLRRFFFGLDVDFCWDETLLLIRGLWATFGVARETDWNSWKKEMLQQYFHEERLKGIIDRFGLGR